MTKPRRKDDIHRAALARTVIRPPAPPAPVEAPAPIISRDWTVAFLAALAEGMSVTRAVRRAGVARSTVYAARALRPDFAAIWDGYATENARSRAAAAPFWTPQWFTRTPNASTTQGNAST